MSRPESPTSLHDGEPKNIPRLHTRRSKSIEKRKSYRLFPTVEPTPPATPVALQKLSQSRVSLGAPRSRSVSFDSTAAIAAEPQNAAVKTVAVRRGRKASVTELKHMSTVPEIPSPTVSIPYSFLPRTSEDTGHARSSSAPGEFVRDSQTLPNARIDLSKPQWTSKQADSHPAKGLGLSMPASVSVDCLDQNRGPRKRKPKPNLTIEIKKDARLQPKAVVVRDEDLPGDDEMPPPPPPKSPRHDSRNQSLTNIQYDPQKARPTQSRTASRSSEQSHSSPDSAQPSDEATIAPQGSLVKAALVDKPSSSSPALPKPSIQHARQESYSPLSGDVRIKELMIKKNEDAQDDLDRPIPPPITPGQPRVASMARVMSIPSLPKAVSVEKPAVKQIPEESSEKPELSQSESKSKETIVPIKQVVDGARKLEQPTIASESAAEKPKPVKQGSQSDSQATNSPASSKPASAKTTKLNLDKPMPSLPPSSSRFSEHMRQVRAAEGPKSEDAPPVPHIQADVANVDVKKDLAVDDRAQTSVDKMADSAASHVKIESSEPERARAANGDGTKQESAAGPIQAEERQVVSASRGPAKGPKGPALSAFPSVPPPPQYYPRGTRGDSPSGRPPMGQRPPPPPDMRQRGPPRERRDSSPARRFPPGHQMHQSARPPFIPPPPHPPREQGPPRSRFYARQSETASNAQKSPTESGTKSEARKDEAARETLASPEPTLQAKKPDIVPRSLPVPVQTPAIEHRSTPILEAEPHAEKDAKQPRARAESDRKEATQESKSALLQPGNQQEHLKRPQSPANLSRAPSPTPSQRPNSAGDLLNKASGDKSLPSLPPEPGPRPTTPDAVSVLTMDTKVNVSHPMQTLRDLTKQSEALHARHASLRADRLKLSTTISASLKDSKPGPEYANALLDQHLSLNAINSSLDICFAKLKSLDCKKEEAIQALIEQMKEKQLRNRKHKTSSSSVATHSTQASSSAHSSKASTPDIGSGPLPALQERESMVSGSLGAIGVDESAAAKPQDGDVQKAVNVEENGEGSATDENERGSLLDGLPTPRPIVPPKETQKPAESAPSSTEPSPVDQSTTSGEAKRNTMVKRPTVSPASSLFTKERLDMSPVSPIEVHDDNDDVSAEGSRRITVKGAKAAKILGLVAGGRAESPSGITLPDDSPTESKKEFAVEIKIPRKPVPGKAKPPTAPTRQVPIPPQPGRKGTNDSASTVQTDSSPESEVRTPRASQEELMPKSLNIGKKGLQTQQRPQRPVQVASDEDILDYYAR